MSLDIQSIQNEEGMEIQHRGAHGAENQFPKGLYVSVEGGLVIAIAPFLAKLLGITTWI